MTIRKNKFILYYFVLPVLIVLTMVISLSEYFSDFEKAISVSLDMIQGLAIIIGGLWAYNKFDWHKKAGDALKLKSAACKFRKDYLNAKITYLIGNSDNVETTEEGYVYPFAEEIIKAVSEFTSKLESLVYLPKELIKESYNLADMLFDEADKNTKFDRTKNIDDYCPNFEKKLARLSQKLDGFFEK